MFMYLRVDHWVPAMCRSLAAARLRQDWPSGLDAGAISLQTSGSFAASGVGGLSEGISVASQGATGNPVNGEFDADPTAGNAPFDGTAGGAVSVVLEGAGSVALAGTGTGPSLTGLSAVSAGGDGTYGYYVEGGLGSDPVPFYGDGGSGGAVTVSTDAGSSIDVTQTAPGNDAVGVSALSRGGTAGAFYGMSGGEVSVTQDGAISVAAPLGIGISARSIGGDGNASALVTNGGGGQPGNGGAVTVSASAGSGVDLADGGIGIFALSQAGAWIPAGSTHLPSGGTVSVSLESGASVTTGGASGSPDAFSFGALAISAGSPLVTETNYGNLAGGGTAGAVSITNAGAVTTNGALAIGLAGLGIGGTPVVASVDSGVNAVGNSGDTSGGAGSGVSITNSGTITMLGLGAAAVAAISAGSVGIVANDAPAVASGAGWTSGTLLGADTQSGSPGLDAETVGVTNSGAITTGNGTGGGVAAIGILAQSIGGGGGNAANASGGFVATGGAGGAGGEAEITTSGAGSVSTLGNYAGGLVAQSIGIGGGGGAATSYSAGILFSVSTALGGTGGTGGGVTGTNGGTIVTGVAPGSLENEGFVAGTGLLYGAFPDGRTIDGADLATGALANGALSGTLASVALSDGSVIEDATIAGATLTGMSNGATVSFSLEQGGIYHAVATRSTCSASRSAAAAAVARAERRRAAAASRPPLSRCNSVT